MATGDQADISARLKALLPPWFPDVAPIASAVVAGPAKVLTFAYDFIQFVRAQTRIATATGGWIDLIAWDYFGVRFMRRRGEADDSFQARILPEILRPRSTRVAITRMLTDLTGRAPVIREPWNPGDCGAYGNGTMAYSQAGCYGSLLLVNQVFVTSLRPLGAGIPSIAGYGTYGGGYGVGAMAYVDMSQIVGPVTDAEIYQRTADVIAAGVTAWEQIVTNLPPAPPAPGQPGRPGQYLPMGF
jgi:hypothetical protein